MTCTRTVSPVAQFKRTRSSSFYSKVEASATALQTPTFCAGSGKLRPAQRLEHWIARSISSGRLLLNEEAYFDSDDVFGSMRTATCRSIDRLKDVIKSRFRRPSGEPCIGHLEVTEAAVTGIHSTGGTSVRF
jgi:hypothetical protein